jgi:hypothetical protein
MTSFFTRKKRDNEKGARFQMQHHGKNQQETTNIFRVDGAERDCSVAIEIGIRSTASSSVVVS